MKAFLLYPNADMDMTAKSPVNEKWLTQDLELNVLFAAMGGGNDYIREISKKVLLTAPLIDVAGIEYRQDILNDCLRNTTVIRELYAISLEAIEKQKGVFLGYMTNYPSRVLFESVRLMEMLVSSLRRLVKLSEQHAPAFNSTGFRRFFSMIRDELNDAYFDEIADHLKRLKFRDGVLIRAELGRGNKGKNYTLRRLEHDRWAWIHDIFNRSSSAFTYHLHPRDEAGARALSELNDRGIALVANTMAQATEHVLSFFSMLRSELAFYVGCIQLQEKLSPKGAPICFPRAVPMNERLLSFEGLCDASLMLTSPARIIGNDLKADDKLLIMVTGANQGGKSTFLRSVGLAHLMMQAGMFVVASSFRANICDKIFTHYKREEDASMESGKFDEELRRMNGIVGGLTENSLLLFNESFAATNEREGSEVARQIIGALTDQHIKVVFVTHLQHLSLGLYSKGAPDAIFLRAERSADGSRTFKIVEGPPLDTSYGHDLYHQIFAA